MNWAKPVLGVEPKNFPPDWGFPPSSEDRLNVLNVWRLSLKFIREEGGKISVWCPEVDISAFGSNETEAWSNFLIAFNEAREFFFANRASLSEDLQRRFGMFDQLYFFVKVEEQSNAIGKGDSQGSHETGIQHQGA
jgi:hypothetical protein